MTEATAPEQFRGSLAIPSENDRRDVTVVIDRSDGSVTLNFDEPVAGSAEWRGENVLLSGQAQVPGDPVRHHGPPGRDGRAHLEDEPVEARQHHRRGRGSEAEYGACAGGEGVYPDAGVGWNTSLVGRKWRVQPDNQARTLTSMFRCRRRSRSR